MTVAPTPPAVAPLAALSAVVDEVLADRGARSAATLGEELVDIRRQIDRLEAAFAERLSRFARLRGHLAQGALSVVAWLRHRCRVSGHDAVVRASVARSLPAVAGAPTLLERGDIGIGHAGVIAQAVEDLGATAAGAAREPLLDAAQHFDCDRFATVARHLRHALDPTGELAGAQRRHGARFLRLWEQDTMWQLEGRLDGEAGAVLRAALEPLARPAAGDQRSLAVRRADALVELARRQLDGGGALPAVRGERPHLVVTTTLDTLAGVRGAPAAQLSGGATLPSETVRRIGCDAGVTRLGATAETAREHGGERRTVPPRLRRALVARDGGCCFPSCDRPPEWTDAHHLVHWVGGGKTRLNNLVLLCRRHHRYVHEGGWHIGWGDDGAIVVRPP